MKHAFLRTFAVLAFISLPAYAETELTLNKSFVEHYKNRVTITTDFLIDAAKDKPNTGSNDGDLHVAGRPSDEVGLITVAEIQNAKDVMDAVKLVQDNTNTGNPVRMTGVWRVWFEHSGGSDQVQGHELKKAKGTNPDHVFEIHPLTRVGDFDLLSTLTPIPGYTKPDNTADRLRMVEGMQARLQINDEDETVTIRTSGNKPNYIHFIIKKLPGDHGYQRVDHTWTQPSDGMFLFAKLYDLDEEKRVHKRRVAFVKGSEPFKKAETLEDNRCLDVLGITRVNLELIAWRVRNAKKRPEVLNWSLPYELVAVGVKGDSWHCAESEDE
jgi:hypothetical protein